MTTTPALLARIQGILDLTRVKNRTAAAVLAEIETTHVLVPKELTPERVEYVARWIWVGLGNNKRIGYTFGYAPVDLQRRYLQAASELMQQLPHLDPIRPIAASDTSET